MKKMFAISLSIIMILSIVSCSNNSTPPASNTPTPKVSDATPEAPVNPEPEVTNTPIETPELPEATPSEPEMSTWLKTKTGKFYSQFSDKKMYMEYETEYNGETMVMITATDGEKAYSESKTGDKSSISIIDGTNMYAIDRSSKTVIKMPLQADTQEMVNTILEEEDVNPDNMKVGTREINGKTYDTEEWSVAEGQSIMCFDGDKLAYIIGNSDGTEIALKINKIDTKVDASLFEIPADYQVMDMAKYMPQAE